MNHPAFIPTAPLRVAPLGTAFLHRTCRTICPCQPTRISRASPKMLVPPEANRRIEPPLTPEQLGPPGYKWNPDYPGTLKPGSEPDNFPLEKVLESDVYEVMQYQELDMDERTTEMFEPDEDLLHWLAAQGRLIPREAEDDEEDWEIDRQMSGITEEDLDYGDEDNKMIAYYSKQGEGSSIGSGSDFGGFADSSANFGSGF